MDRASDRRLIRFLHGELTPEEARQVRADLVRDKILAARFEELQRVWQDLRPPPATPPPFGFSQQLVRRTTEVRQLPREGALGWAAAPLWARGLAAGALVGGVALGLGLARMEPGLLSPPVAARRVPPAVQAFPPIAAATSPTPAPAVRAGMAPTGPPHAARAPVGARVPERAAPAMIAQATPPLVGEPTFAEEYWQALAGASGDEDSLQ